MNKKTIVEINTLIKELISYGDVFKSNKGKGTKLLPPRCSEIVTKEIPSNTTVPFPDSVCVKA